MDLDRILEWVKTAPNKRPATKDSIARKLRACAKHADFLTDPVATVDMNYDNTNTKLDLLLTFRSLSVLCPHFTLDASQRDDLDVLVSVLTDERQSNYQARERRPTDVLWEEILAFEEHVKRRDLLIFRLFTCLPPQRNSDYAMMRIVQDLDDESDNVFVRSTQTFVFRDYKNVQARGVHTVNVPDAIVEVICKNNKYLFQKKSGCPIGFAAMSNRITTCFSKLGAGVGAITLRRSFASHQLASGMTGLQLLHAANASSHTMAMHRYYAFRQ